MSRKGLWIGFAAFLVLGIFASYLPDIRHAETLRAARETGLSPYRRARVAPKDDAFPYYGQAIQNHPSAGDEILAGNVTNQDVVDYLRKIAAASAKPGCSFLPDGARYGPGYGSSYQAATLYHAAKALAAQAKDEAGLLPAARIASHLRQQDGVSSLAYWAGLVQAVADRADALHLGPTDRERLRAPMGPSAPTRDMLRRHAAWTLWQLERQMPKDVYRFGPIAQEADYVGFWVRWLRKTPSDDALLARYLGRTNEEIDRAELLSTFATDFSWADPAKPRWQQWSERLEAANARWRALR